MWAHQFRLNTDGLYRQLQLPILDQIIRPIKPLAKFTKMRQELKFQSALLSTGWADNVSIHVNQLGDIDDIQVGVSDCASGFVVPGISNLHSHAHQRAMAGLAETAGSSEDSFWTWRKTMYQFLDAMQPQHLHAIASQLYIEMLAAGYTRVAEFQYLHHQQDGSHYDDIGEMSLQTLSAAHEVGLGITSLPVHYQFGGFAEQPVGEQQRRFYNDPESFLKIVESLDAACRDMPNASIGIAGHSLRATNVQSFSQILANLEGDSIPIHMHIAEQAKEIDDCLEWSGLRPVDYCLSNFDVNENWCLIHATHMTDAETLALANSGAVVGLCPTTEANLGDGLFNAKIYLDAGGKLGIGSDSHISISPVEELRWMEYAQRLQSQSRNRLSGGPNSSTGRTLFDIATAGGAQACGHASGVLEIGKRADLVVLDPENPLLVGRQGDEILDSWIFSGNRNSVKHVYVGGQHVIKDGRHQAQQRVSEQFKRTLSELRN